MCTMLGGNVVIKFFNSFRHYKSPPFHTVIRIHLTSLSYHILVIFPSHFSSMEQMLMLMLTVTLVYYFIVLCNLSVASECP